MPVQRPTLGGLIAGLLVLAACAPRATVTMPAAPVLTPQTTGATARFIGISPVDANVVWISGTNGTFARTLDGGQTWAVATVPGADTLQFRDIHAVDATTAYLLSIGPGEASRIYKTTDGGASWMRQFTNEVANAFYDCLAFWDAQHGIAFSDAVDGVFPIIITDDGGATWEHVPAAAIPPALPSGEGSFAASGTCLITHGAATAWFGTGAGGRARVFKTTDRGQTWTVAETPIVSGGAAGIASLAFRDALHGAALGGDIAAPELYSDNVAVTDDGGETWRLAGRPAFTGAVYGAAFVPATDTPSLVAVGPKGLSFSIDNGQAWWPLGEEEHWSVAFAPGTATGWAVGPEGRVTRIDF